MAQVTRPDAIDADWEPDLDPPAIRDPATLTTTTTHWEEARRHDMYQLWDSLRQEPARHEPARHEPSRHEPARDETSRHDPPPPPPPTSPSTQPPSSHDLRLQLKVVRDLRHTPYDRLTNGETIGAFAHHQAIRRYTSKVCHKRERAREMRRRHKKKLAPDDDDD